MEREGVVVVIYCAQMTSHCYGIDQTGTKKSTDLKLCPSPSAVKVLFQYDGQGADRQAIQYGDLLGAKFLVVAPINWKRHHVLHCCYHIYSAMTGFSTRFLAKFS